MANTPASLPRRLGAVLYDALLVIALWMTTLWILVPIADAPLTGAWVQSLFFIEAYAFFAYFWTRNQQTLGMQAWRIRVQNADGSPISLRQCLLRFLTGAVSLLLMGLGHWWMLVDRQRRSWPDIASRSEIVRAPGRVTPSAGAHSDEPERSRDADRDEHRDDDPG